MDLKKANFFVFCRNILLRVNLSISEECTSNCSISIELHLISHYFDRDRSPLDVISFPSMLCVNTAAHNDEQVEVLLVTSNKTISTIDELGIRLQGPKPFRKLCRSYLLECIITNIRTERDRILPSRQWNTSKSPNDYDGSFKCSKYYLPSRVIYSSLQIGERCSFLEISTFQF